MVEFRAATRIGQDPLAYKVHTRQIGAGKKGDRGYTVFDSMLCRGLMQFVQQGIFDELRILPQGREHRRSGLQPA